MGCILCYETIDQCVIIEQNHHNITMNDVVGDFDDNQDIRDIC